MKYIFLIPGVILSLAAVFAYQLGIDNDAGWGGGRTLILEVGIALMILGAALHIFQGPLRRLQSHITTIIERGLAIRTIFAISILLVAAAYLWFIRLDARDTSRSYNYYSELARSFKQGRLYLTETPSPALLALSNPYDYALRKQAGVEDFPWDASLYDGRFFIYWGPSPSLFLLPLTNETLTRIEDHHLALVFAFGLFIYAALIVTTFWQKLKDAPIWVYVASLLVMGFSIPVTTMLSSANVYETAIFACQFFFIGGCYWTYLTLNDEAPAMWKSALAGIHWALAIGARVTILPVVSYTVLILLIPFFLRIRDGSWKSRLPSVLAIVIPLLLAGILLGGYNWARFDSIFEFGVRYQLANVDYTQFDGSFSLRYVAANLETYFLHPVQIGRRFPFLSLVEYVGSNDRLSGLLYISPFFLLLLFLLLRSLVLKRNVPALGSDSRFVLLLGGAAAISAFIVLIFYFVTLRYTLDFMPSALILTILLLGQEFDFLNAKRVVTGILSFVFGVLALINVTAGTLLATPESGVLFMVNALNAISKLLGLR